MHKSQAYTDLAIIKALVPMLSSAARDFHRWRYNEMILETYQMAKKRKNTWTASDMSLTMLPWTAAPTRT